MIPRRVCRFDAEVDSTSVTGIRYTLVYPWWCVLGIQRRRYRYRLASILFAFAFPEAKTNHEPKGVVNTFTEMRCYRDALRDLVVRCDEFSPANGEQIDTRAEHALLDATDDGRW